MPVMFAGGGARVPSESGVAHERICKVDCKLFLRGKALGNRFIKLAIICVQRSQFELLHAYALLPHPGLRHQTHI